MLNIHTEFISFKLIKEKKWFDNIFFTINLHIIYHYFK